MPRAGSTGAGAGIKSDGKHDGLPTIDDTAENETRELAIGSSEQRGTRRHAGRDGGRKAAIVVVARGQPSDESSLQAPQVEAAGGQRVRTNIRVRGGEPYTLPISNEDSAPSDAGAASVELLAVRRQEGTRIIITSHLDEGPRPDLAMAEAGTQIILSVPQGPHEGTSADQRVAKRTGEKALILPSTTR